MAFIALGLLVVGEILTLKGRTIHVPSVFFCVLLVALLPPGLYFSGVGLFAGDALLGTFYLVSFAAAIFLGYAVAQQGRSDENIYRFLIHAIWIPALVSAAIGLLQWLSLYGLLGPYIFQTPSGERSLGNLGQPNHLATFLLMGIVALAITFESKGVGRTGLFVGVGFMSWVLVLTQSRSGMLSVLLITAYLVWKNQQVSLRVSTRYVLIWLGFYAAAVFCLPYINDALLLVDRRSVNPSIDNARMLIWKQVLTAIMQSPWLGYGWNQTATAHAAASVAVPGSLSYSHAHNIVLDVLAWTGIPIGLLLTALSGYWFLTRLMKARSTHAVYAMCAIIPVALHSMVEYPFAYSYFMITAAVMMGIVEKDYATKTILHFRKIYASIGLAICAVVGSGVVYEYILIEEDFRVVRFENLRVGRTPEEYKVPDIVLLTHMRAMLEASRQRPARNMSASELENLRTASLRFPYSILGLRYALALGVNNDPVGATRQMDVVRGMYGVAYYKAAVVALREQQIKFPELSQVVTRE